MDDSTRGAETIWTVGHSTRSLEQLVDLLRGHGIGLLVDVRTVPRSRRNPQFNRDTLPGELEQVGIAYRHEPGLGGLRKPRRDSVNTAWRNAGFRGYADHMQTPEFEERIEALLVLASERPMAVMCAEALPWRCHRSLVSDALTVRGVEVRHIHRPARADLHQLTPFARIDGRRITYPGLDV
jgi:uncharacterized protein (DUF488 family)